MTTGNFADYAFGSGTKAITFIYTVQEGDNAEALDAWNAPAHGELSVRPKIPATLQSSCLSRSF